MAYFIDSNCVHLNSRQVKSEIRFYFKQQFFILNFLRKNKLYSGTFVSFQLSSHIFSLSLWQCIPGCPFPILAKDNIIKFKFK